MAILNPDTSKIPLWRRRPTRLEHPIHAWRVWELQPKVDGYILSSVATAFDWEGPVVRAHKRPVDPSYWDKKDKDSTEYYREMEDSFSVAGIHALKTREQAVEAAAGYAVDVYGEVLLWGRVAQFKLGYRAEACMIKRLFLSLRAVQHYKLFTPWGAQRLDDIASALSKRYECEVSLG